MESTFAERAPHRDAGKGVPRGPRFRLLLMVEQSAPSRYWEGVVPLLQAFSIEAMLVTVRRRGPLHASLEALGCPTFALNCDNSRDYPLAALRMARLLRRQQVDLVHLHEPIPAIIGGIGGVLAGRAARIFHRHHSVPEGCLGPLSRLSSRLAHMTVAVSRAAAQHAQETDRVPLSRIRVAYNGVHEMRHVPGEELVEIRRQLGIPSQAPVISIVARLRPQKGHRTLLDAMVLISAVLPQPPHLIVAGAGAEEAALKNRARSLALATVHFVGHQEDVAPWFALADVVAMPSYWEPFGLSAIEAMACSRPLVASRVEGLAEIVEDDVSGLLVDPQDPKALATALLRVLQCPETATRLATVGYQRFRAHFTLESMASAWRDCYEEALAAQGRRERSDAGPLRRDLEAPSLPRPVRDRKCQEICQQFHHARGLTDDASKR
jgi:glycosyltransferase involved in cell wall biosynthesis